MKRNLNFTVNGEAHRVAVLCFLLDLVPSSRRTEEGKYVFSVCLGNNGEPNETYFIQQCASLMYALGRKRIAVTNIEAD